VDIVLNRRGGVPVRDQLVTQLELRILGGEIAPGEKLPSVRSLARRLKLHANTVSASYRILHTAGLVHVKPGAGVFVRLPGNASPREARNLDEFVRLTLDQAFRKGWSGAEIREAVERWLKAAPPDRVVTVDRFRTMAELLLAEIAPALRLPGAAHSLEEVERDPATLTGALTVVVPYHAEALRAAAEPGAAIEVVNLELPPAEREALLAVPAGATLLVVSHSEAVLPFASNLARSLRGAELLVEARRLNDTRGWRRLLPAADVVFADVIAAPVLRRSRTRRVREFRVVAEAALARLRKAARVVVPRSVR
jgi:DNA-binding transcriptional regulator YhcF (GntR family)